MNGSTDLRTIQQKLITYFQKKAKDEIDAVKWESLENETYRLSIYRDGVQSAFLFTKSELQSCFLEGWELSLEE